MISKTVTTDRSARAPTRNYSRKRAATLMLVYVLMGLHIAHWKVAGETLAPLELNEVMYTLELGVVTAGFLFMAIAVLSVLLFGRFFCSWGCHILALEDLCSWLLEKIRIKPQPIRSRLLLLVPPLAMFYMFLWPQVGRVIGGEPLPTLHIEGDEGWASFVTNDYWRNLPGPWVAGLTFFVCGFAVVYVLGSRSFCRYACPYGAIFGLADRFAPGRITAVGDCAECGKCTAVCQSQVRVKEELAAYGTVVDPACLKDLDCIAVCPNDAIGYRFRRPSLFKSWKKLEGVSIRPSFDVMENILMAVVFVAALATFRGLYGFMPFLMTLTLAGIFAYLAVMGARLIRRESVRLKPFHLKRSGQLTGSGRAYVCVNVALLAFFGHSAFIRTNEYLGSRAFERLEHGNPSVSATSSPKAVSAAITQLERVERWGLVDTVDIEHKLARLHLRSDSPQEAEPYLRKIIEHNPNSLATQLRLASILHQTGRTEAALAETRAALAALDGCPDPEYVATVQCEAHELLAEIRIDARDAPGAVAEYEAALAAQPESASAHLALGNLLAAMERLPEAVEHFTALVELEPESAAAHYNLAVLLVTLGNTDQALSHYRRAAELDPSDPEIQNNLGFLLATLGERQAAQQHFENALRLQPAFAHAHFNLGRLLLEEGRTEEARRHLEQAARLDRRYAELLARMREE